MPASADRRYRRSKDVRYVGTQLFVNADETTVSTSTPALPASRFLPFGTRPTLPARRRNAAVQLVLFCLPSHINTVFFRFNGGNFGFQHQVNFLLIRLVKTLTMSLSAAGKPGRTFQPRQSVNPARGIRSHLQTDDTATHYQQAFWYFFHSSASVESQIRGSSCGINGS